VDAEKAAMIFVWFGAIESGLEGLSYVSRPQCKSEKINKSTWTPNEQVSLEIENRYVYMLVFEKIGSYACRNRRIQAVEFRKNKEGGTNQKEWTTM
jgi:hypothetical protein